MKKLIFSGIIVGVVFASSLSAQYPPQQQEVRGIEVGGYFAGEYGKTKADGALPDGTFGKPLMGMFLYGQPGARLSFQTEVSFADGDRFDINQAWLGVQAANYLSLKLGLYVVPFGRFNENSRPHEIETINAPLNFAYLFPRLWRDVGVTASGNISGLQYSAYLGNGLAESAFLDGGQQFRDNNRHKAWGGRLEWVLEEGFSIGYSYYQGKYDDADSRKQIMQAAAAAWTTADFYVQFEYNHARMEAADGFEDGKAWGYTAQTAMIWRGFRPVVSYQRVFYDDVFHGLGFQGPDLPGEGIALDRTRWALGAVLTLSPNVYLKFEYDFNREKDLEISNDGYFFQIAVGF